MHVSKIFYVFFIILIFISCENQIDSGCNLSIAEFQDARIEKNGRYYDRYKVEDGYNNVYRGGVLTWNGSWLKFKVKNTHSLSVVITGQLSPSSVCFFLVTIDNDKKYRIVYVPKDEIDSDAEYRLLLIDDLSIDEHTVLIQVEDNFRESPLFSSQYWVCIHSFSVDTEGEIGAWKQKGTRNCTLVGDSWAGGENSIARFMFDKGYIIDSVGFGGFTSERMKEYYPKNSAEETIPVEENENIFIIEFGVNDFYAHITESAYKQNISDLIDTIRFFNGDGCHIYILQVPRYIGAGFASGVDTDIAYDMYETVQKELCAEKYVDYIPTTDIWDSLTWTNDKKHLTYEAKKVFANFVISSLN